MFEAVSYNNFRDILITSFQCPSSQKAMIKKNWTSVDGIPSTYYLTKASAKFTFNGLEGDVLTRKYIISPLTLNLGPEQTRNPAQYHLHHMTCTPAKFEVDMSNG